MKKITDMRVVIFDLQMHGRAGAREIAHRTGMTNEEVIASLVALEKLCKVEQSNGYWWLFVAPVEPVKKVARRKSCTV